MLPWQQQPQPVGSILRESPPQLEPDLAAFYAARQWRPLWIEGARIRPEAGLLLKALDGAGRDGLDPASYRADRLRAALKRAGSGAPGALVQAEFLLSRALGDYARDLRQPALVSQAAFTDPALDRPQATTDFLIAAARAPSLGAHITGLRHMNPLYEQLRAALLVAQDQGAPQREIRLIRANLDRLRVIPPDPGRRFILVDAASQRLWLYEDGRVRETMRVVIGKPAMETPVLAGLIRFAVANPYWNVPPDLIRDKVARHVLEEGPDYLVRERLELLSDFSDDAAILSPDQVDWQAIADGRMRIKVRQLPGDANMMGAVKFMLPNRLGIYLHDTPDKGAFGRADRRLSSGCVRLEDAARLFATLFGRPLEVPYTPETRIDLPEPVPVYLVYLTARPENGRVTYQRDIYRRDPAALARFAEDGATVRRG